MVKGGGVEVIATLFGDPLPLSYPLSPSAAFSYANRP